MARNTRGKYLRNALASALDDKHNKGYNQLLYSNHIINLLKENTETYPSFIDASTFVRGLVDTVGRDAIKTSFIQDPQSLKEKVIEDFDPNPFNRFKDSVEKMNYSPVKVLFRSFIERSTDVESLEKEIELWYNKYMDRVSGWYKRQSRMPVFWIASIITLLFNINFIVITQKVMSDKQIVEKILPSAIALSAKGLPNEPSATIEESVAQIKSITDSLGVYKIPFGWSTDNILCKEKNAFTGFFCTNNEEMKSRGYGTMIWGWLFSIGILSLGAPFWFDILKKLVNFRNSGLNPTENKK